MISHVLSAFRCISLAEHYFTSPQGLRLQQVSLSDATSKSMFCVLSGVSVKDSISRALFYKSTRSEVVTSFTLRGNVISHVYVLSGASV